MGQFVPLPTKVNSQISPKMTDFRYPLSAANAILYYDVRDPLLMTFFITCLRCMRQMKGDSDSIGLPFKGTLVPFPTKSKSQITHKMPEFRYPLSAANWMMYFQERHLLFMKCFKSFIGGMRHMRGASISLCVPFIDHIVPCFTKINSQISHKIRGFQDPLTTASGI